MPTARCSQIGQIYNDHLYIFGGYSGVSYLNDIYQYNFGIFF